MSRDRDESTTTLEAPPAEAQPHERLSLLIIGESSFGTYKLPAVGEVTVGRGQDVDISIDASWISRRHARLHVGDRLRLEDLGSANGTRVRGVSLGKHQVVEVAPGDVIELGLTMLTVQRHSSAQRPRRLWTHAYFEGRLEEECARGEHRARTFSVLRVKIEDAPDDADIETALVGTLDAADVIASYAPDEYEILLLERPRAYAVELEGRIRAVANDEGARVRTGIACHPADGRDPESLMACASAAIYGERAPDGAEERVVVRDGKMQDLHRLLERVAGGSINVVFLGETGVGKEVMAETLHRLSPRAQKPFLKLNCAALPESLLESELFGHEKGAFTGAVRAKPGLLEAADGGTMFLDEIGEMPLPLQVKLLRVTEEGQLLRIGALKPQPIDVRFLAATNRDIESEVGAGRFRQDLYFRLAGVCVVIPPLRERTVEIGALARLFVARSCRQLGRARELQISDEAIAVLQRYRWPGNIRELRNVMERAVLLCRGERIGPEDLPAEKMSAQVVVVGGGGGAAAGAAGGGLRDHVADVERQRILEVLEQCDYNQSRAAKLLGISRNTLLARIKQYGLQRGR